MAVRPTHDCLQHKVQTIQSDRERYFDPAHDSRFDIIELDPEVGDAGGGHAARLRASRLGGQFHGSNSCRRDAG